MWLCCLGQAILGFEACVGIRVVLPLELIEGISTRRPQAAVDLVRVRVRVGVRVRGSHAVEIK